MDVTEQKRKDRTEALQNAVRHRLGTETPDDIVKAAKKYFEFLQSDSGED